MNDLQIDTFFVIKLNEKFIYQMIQTVWFHDITSKNNQKIFQGDYIYDKTINKDEWLVPTHFMNFMNISHTKNQ